MFASDTPLMADCKHIIVSPRFMSVRPKFPRLRGNKKADISSGHHR